MPTPTQMQAFITGIVSNHHVGASERLDYVVASMQANQTERRRGRDRLIAEKRKFLARPASFRTEQVGPLIVDGDFAAIRRRFTFGAADE